MLAFEKQGACWDLVKQSFYRDAGNWVKPIDGFYKQAGAWESIYNDAHYFALTDDTELDLEAFLNSAAPPAGKDIVFIIPPGVTIGSSDPTSPALVTGDLANWRNIVLANYGAVHGAGGQPDSNGGNAIVATNTLHIVNKGEIFAGGGGGITGESTGSPGKMYQEHRRFNPGVSMFKWGSDMLWDGRNLGPARNNAHIGGWLYLHWDRWGGTPGGYDIYREQMRPGDAIAGGAGGLGAGYNQLATPGVKAGNNGTGGGDYGEPGESDDTGRLPGQSGNVIVGEENVNYLCVGDMRGGHIWQA